MAVAHRGFGLGRPGWRASLDVVRTVLIARLKIISRYKGSIFLEALLPIVFAAVPILIGAAVAGGPEAAQSNFQRNTGTTNYRLYMLLGSSTFMVVSIILWLIGYWVRREQETGTLESLYLAPAKRITVLAGVTTYAMVRGIAAFFISLIVGSLVFGVNPLEGNLLLAFAFLAIGLLPLWGIAFLFGAFILKVKEANSVIQLMQWVVAFLMGVYFPVTVFPPVLRWIATAFPPTIMNDGVRAAVLGLGTLFGTWYLSLAVLFAMAFAVPYVGYEMFLVAERRLKRGEGVGQF